MDRCALFVDAGYLLADGAMAVHGTRHRETVSWDFGGLLQLLGELARERTGLPLLRCYWYEATVEGRRSPEHEALADLPGLKLRLGRIRPGRREGVDTEIHRDLMTLARNGALADAVIVSGDEDLAQVVADAQDLGVRVTVVHVAVDGNWTISRVLRQECDDLIELGAGQLRPYVNLLAGVESSTGSSGLPAGPLSNGHGSGSGAGGALGPLQSVSPGGPPPSTPLTGPPQLSGSSTGSSGSSAGSSTSSGSSGSSGPSSGSGGGSTGAYGIGGGVGSTSGLGAGGASPSGLPSGLGSGAGAGVGAAKPGSSDTAPRPALGSGPGSLGSGVGSPSGLGSSAGIGSGSGLGTSGAPNLGSNADLGSGTGGYTPGPASGPGAGAPPQSSSTTGPLQPAPAAQTTAPQSTAGSQFSPSAATGQPVGPYTGPQQLAPVPAQKNTPTLADAVKAAHQEGQDFGESVARDAPALWLEAVLARKPRMPSDLEARLLQGSSLPIDFLLHDEVRHALRRGFWDALERSRR
ncbi:hypothetical protein Arub01_31160 [Actinomadura rubrobrunea]|uniref:NYN domain-containing protein n=1 Tax=Actinomadura rubrobrunea TaxID=115335 RepID=A0A9W6PY61_9ACTN|nr:NYN domain-containing protein [Actinomadura rubrobrunea]GLW64872.1 hypothetical protein Arub01_31160 [Actinomadura rubrobrunea]